MTILLPILALIAGPLDTAWWADESAQGSETNLLDALILHYRFEESEDAARQDSHTGSFNIGGFPASTITQSEDQKVGTYAIQFDGVSGNYLSNSYSDFSYVGGSSFSVNFWFKRHEPSSNYCFAALWSVNLDESAWKIGFTEDHKVTLTIVTESLGQEIATNTTQITDSAYHMVTAVYDSSVTDATIYVDGTGQSAVLDGTYNSSANQLTIGNYGYAAPSSFTMDSFSWWTNRVLSSNDVRTLLNLGSALDYPFTP